MGESNRFVTEDQFRNFCEWIEGRDQDDAGLSLYPTGLWPQLRAQGGAVAGGDVVSFDCSAIDRRESKQLLTDVQAARKRFKGLSDKHCRALDKAEGVWKLVADETIEQAQGK